MQVSSLTHTVDDRRRGDPAAPGGSTRAGRRRGAGEQRRGGRARLRVPAQGGRRESGADDTGEPVGTDTGHGGSAAGDAGKRGGAPSSISVTQLFFF